MVNNYIHLFCRKQMETMILFLSIIQILFGVKGYNRKTELIFEISQKLFMVQVRLVQSAPLGQKIGPAVVGNGKKFCFPTMTHIRFYNINLSKCIYVCEQRVILSNISYTLSFILNFNISMLNFHLTIDFIQFT